MNPTNRRSAVHTLTSVVALLAVLSASRPAHADDYGSVAIAGSVLTIAGAAGVAGAVGCAESYLPQTTRTTCIGALGGVGGLFVLIGIPLILFGVYGPPGVSSLKPASRVGINLGRHAPFAWRW